MATETFHPGLIIERRPWSDPAGEALRVAQQAEICAIYGTPDSEPGGPPSGGDVAVFVVARDGDALLGCGALRALDSTSGEVKRMFVVPGSRGSGVASAVLDALEDAARGLGWSTLRLETGDRLVEAIRFYERSGYSRIPNYGVYADSEISLCYEKELA